jgi:chaperonin cofactor prefoldin
LYLQEITWIIGIISFIGGIAIFLFKKIVIEPLQKSIDSLNKTIQRLESSTNKQLEIHDKEIDILKEKTTRHEEQIKTLFSKKESV